MGGYHASFVVLADAVDAAQRFVEAFVGVYVLLIFVYILMSWIRVPYSLNKLQRFLYDVCEPYVRLYRRILPPLGPLDLSPIVAVVALIVVEQVVVRLLERLH